MFKKNVWILIKISLKFVPKGPINSIPVLVQKMAWRCSGTRSLSELILVICPTHICVIWPQWVERQPATKNRDGHGHRRWQGNGTVLGERKTHTKAKYADTKIQSRRPPSIMTAMASKITSLTIVYSTAQRASNAKKFPFDGVIMTDILQMIFSLTSIHFI